MRSLWMDIDVEDEPQDIWSIPTPPSAEKKFGKHPTQKPLALLERIILASTRSRRYSFLTPLPVHQQQVWQLSGMAGVSLALITNTEYLELSVKRLEEELAKTKRQTQID